MVTLTDIKTYLRIDDNSNDDLLILLKESAIATMRQSITDFEIKYKVSEEEENPDFIKIADLCTVILIAELYDKRIGDGTQAIRYSYIAGNMLEILEYYPVEVTEAG